MSLCVCVCKTIEVYEKGEIIEKIKCVSVRNENLYPVMKLLCYSPA